MKRSLSSRSRLLAIVLTALGLVIATAGAAWSLTVKQNSTDTIASGTSFSCNTASFHRDNTYLRRFDLDGAFGVVDPSFDVTSVKFGVELASSGGPTQPANVRIYTIAASDPTMTFADLTLLQDVPTTVAPSDTGTVVTVAVNATVINPAANDLVVALYTPTGAGNEFFIGANSDPESGPSYIAAPDCGVNEPATTGSLGFPNAHWVLYAEGSSGPPIPNVSPPVISGTAQVGQTLTVTTPAVWGTTPDAVSYQWFADGNPIPSATGTSLVLTAAELNTTITVKETADKAGYSTTTVASNGLGPVAPGTINNTVLPAITGTLQAYGTLHVSTGTWSPASVSLDYQWLLDGDPITGATGTDYVLQPGDVGHQIRVRVTASKTGYTSETVWTDPAGPVQQCVFRTVTAPTVIGSAAVGETLDAFPGTRDPEPGSLSYQWLADGQPIAGATGPSYEVTAGDVGKRITVRVTASKPGCVDASATSAATSPVAAAALHVVTHPVITGDPVVGNTMTVDGGTWDATPATTSYQWTRGGVPIPGATGASYTPVAADVGEFLAVTVTVTAPGYADGHATTSANGLVRLGDIASTTAPSVSGTPRAGRTLTASPGAWSVTPDDVALQWYSDGQAIDGATGDSLVLDDPSLVGTHISVKATATKAGYSPSSATSAEVGPVSKAPVTMTKTFSTKHPALGTEQVGIDVTVSAPDGLPVEGTVRVLVDGAVVDSGELNGNGSVHLVLPAFQNPGKHKVKIKYGGSQLLAKKAQTAYLYPQ